MYELLSYMLVLSNPVESLASAMIIMMMAITMMIVIMIINHCANRADVCTR